MRRRPAAPISGEEAAGRAHIRPGPWLEEAYEDGGGGGGSKPLEPTAAAHLEPVKPKSGAQIEAHFGLWVFSFFF